MDELEKRLYLLADRLDCSVFEIETDLDEDSDEEPTRWTGYYHQREGKPYKDEYWVMSYDEADRALREEIREHYRDSEFWRWNDLTNLIDDYAYDFEDECRQYYEDEVEYYSEEQVVNECRDRDLLTDSEEEMFEDGDISDLDVDDLRERLIDSLVEDAYVSNGSYKDWYVEEYGDDGLYELIDEFDFASLLDDIFTSIKEGYSPYELIAQSDEQEDYVIFGPI